MDRDTEVNSNDEVQFSYPELDLCVHYIAIVALYCEKISLGKYEQQWATKAKRAQLTCHIVLTHEVLKP